MDQQTSNPQRTSIRASMQEKDTEELLAIWQNRDTNEWTEEAFGMVEAILLERLGSLPERGAGDEPIDKMEEENDTYHDPDRLEKTATRASQVGIGFLIVAILLFLDAIVIIVDGVVSRPGMPLGPLFLTYSPTALLYFVLVLACGFFYVALKAIEEGLYLLLDIEVNTRENKKV